METELAGHHSGNYRRSEAAVGESARRPSWLVVALLDLARLDVRDGLGQPLPARLRAARRGQHERVELERSAAAIESQDAAAAAASGGTARPRSARALHSRH